MSSLSIQSALLDALRQQIVNVVVKTQFLVGNTWYDAEFFADVGDNSIVHINMVITPVSGAATLATKFRLLDSSNAVLAEKSDNVQFIAGVDSMLYRFNFNVTVDQGGE